MFDQIVIVGAGQAAVQAVDTLRRKGFTGKLAVVGDEPWLPYQRPPLSKKYLAGALERDRLMIRPTQFYTDHSVQTHLGRRVEEIARSEQRLRLDDGSTLAYDALLLATGSRPRKLVAPGADLGGVHYLRTMADVERIRADFGKFSSKLIRFQRILNHELNSRPRRRAACAAAASKLRT